MSELFSSYLRVLLLDTFCSDLKGNSPVLRSTTFNLPLAATDKKMKKHIFLIVFYILTLTNVQGQEKKNEEQLKTETYNALLDWIENPKSDTTNVFDLSIMEQFNLLGV